MNKPIEYTTRVYDFSDGVEDDWWTIEQRHFEEWKDYMRIAVGADIGDVINEDQFRNWMWYIRREMYGLYIKLADRANYSPRYIGDIVNRRRRVSNTVAIALGFEPVENGDTRLFRRKAE